MPVLAGRYSEVLCAVSAEVAQRSKIHMISYLGERQAFVIQIAFQYRDGVAVYKRCDTVPGYSFNCSGEVFG